MIGFAPKKNIRIMNPPKFALIGRENQWISAFAVEACMAESIVDTLNRVEEDGWANWIVITDPIDASEIRPTIESWIVDGIV